MAIDSSGTALENTAGLPQTTPLATSATPATQSLTPSINPAIESKVNVAPTMNATDLSSPQAETPKLPGNPNLDTSFIQSLQTGTPASGIPGAPELQKGVETAQGSVDQTTQEINRLMTQLGYKGTETQQLQQAANLPGLQKELTDLNTQYAQKKSQYAAQLQRIGAQNIPSLFVSGQQALATAAANSDLGATAAMIQAAQGNINTAFNTIDKTIEQKYKPIQDNIDAQLKYYALNMDKLTVAQQKLATRQSDILSAQKTNIANEQARIKDSIGSITDAIKAYTIEPNVGFQAISDLLNNNITPAEAMQKLGLATQEAYGGSGITDLSKGIVAGYDISKYATDPKHEEKVTNIYNNITSQGGASDASSAQSIITNLAQKSPVTGDMVMSSALKYGVDPNMLIAMMQQDSSLGTAGLGAKTNNPGNVGNDDAGNIKKFNTVGEGVDAVAKWLSNHKAEAPVGADYAKYGALANTDFQPTQKVDSKAFTYLQAYFNKGVVPTATDVGLPKNQASSKLFGAIQTRANDLYYQATGSSLPDVSILKGNKALITGNNKLANNLNIQEGTVAKNFKLALDNIDKNGINQSAQPINAFINMIKNAMGDPDIAQYITQNGTLQNEVGSLIAIKNASGTTVADKLASAGLIPANASEAQQKAILRTLLQEAENGFNTIQQTSGDLYSQIDPLQLQTQNPLRQEQVASSKSKLPQDIQQKITSSLTRGEGNTVYLPRSVWSTLGANMDAVLAEAKADGYDLKIKD